MSDRDLRELERQARSGDAQAMEEWARASWRAQTAQVQRLRVVHERLLAAVLRLERSIDAMAVVRWESVRWLGRGAHRAGFDWAVLASAAASGWDEHYDGPVQHHVVGLSAKHGAHVVLAVGGTTAKSATPGTTWPALQPWRANTKRETLVKRVGAWLDGAGSLPTQGTSANHLLPYTIEVVSEDDVALWLELERVLAPWEWGVGSSLEAGDRSPENTPTSDALAAWALIAERLEPERAQAWLWGRVGVERPGDAHDLGLKALVEEVQRSLGQEVAPTPPADAASEKQVRFVLGLKRRLHLSADEFQGLLRRKAGVEEVELLTKRGASQVIDALQAWGS